VGDAFLVGCARVTFSHHNLPRSVRFCKANDLKLWNLLISEKGNGLVSSTLTRLRQRFLFQE